MTKLFYLLKPLIPRSLQIALRQQIVFFKRRSCQHYWPIDEDAGRFSRAWRAWPGKKQFALILTHDVDTHRGHQKCASLMDMEIDLGFRSSFNFVPERYRVSKELRTRLKEHGFEIGLHGLKHDGKLYSSKAEFQKRAIRINELLKEWGAVGFRSPSMHHNLAWINELNIEYDASTFDTDPFEPQSDGVHTIFPFRVQGNGRQKDFIELPYTLPQDFTLFILLKEPNIEIWKKKLDWIVAKKGMALVNVHPDYIRMNENSADTQEYPLFFYVEFLKYILDKYHGQYWHVTPSKIAKFYYMMESRKKQ